MPLYTFRNKETGEYNEFLLSLEEREEYLKSNPHIEQVLLQAPVVSSHDRMRQNVAFQERLKQIHDNTYGSTIDQSKAMNSTYFGGD